MALLKRFDANIGLLEELLMAHHRRGLEQFIDQERQAGNELTKTAAVVEIVERYLVEHGYAGDTNGSDTNQLAENSWTSESLKYLAPFVTSREPSVMEALANGDLTAAVNAAKDAERARDVGT